MEGMKRLIVEEVNSFRAMVRSQARAASQVRRQDRYDPFHKSIQLIISYKFSTPAFLYLPETTLSIHPSQKTTSMPRWLSAQMETQMVFRLALWRTIRVLSWRENWRKRILEGINVNFKFSNVKLGFMMFKKRI